MSVAPLPLAAVLGDLSELKTARRSRGQIEWDDGRRFLAVPVIVSRIVATLAMAVCAMALCIVLGITLPPAVRAIIPPLGEALIGMAKTTALASVIQDPEVLHNAKSIDDIKGRVIELPIVAGLCDLAVVSVLAPLQMLLRGCGGAPGHDLRRQSPGPYATAPRREFMAFVVDLNIGSQLRTVR